MPADVNRMKALKNQVAVVGVGDTDYLADYRAGARGNAIERGSRQKTAYQLALTAFQRALADAGIDKSMIDGMVTGGGLSGDRTCEILGINPSWRVEGDSAGSVIAATQAIASGLCTTVVCMMGNAQRSNNAQFGGPEVQSGPLSYYYYAPW